MWKNRGALPNECSTLTLTRLRVCEIVNNEEQIYDTLPNPVRKTAFAGFVPTLEILRSVPKSEDEAQPIATIILSRAKNPFRCASIVAASPKGFFVGLKPLLRMTCGLSSIKREHPCLQPLYISTTSLCTHTRPSLKVKSPPWRTLCKDRVYFCCRIIGVRIYEIISLLSRG
jgi:hypothetical protein